MSAKLHLYDVATAAERFPMRGHGGPVGFLNFTDDGRKLVSGSESLRVGFPPEVITWDAKTWAEICRVQFLPYLKKPRFVDSSKKPER
jgi:hypothetical protein